MYTLDWIGESLLLKKTRRTKVGAHVHLQSGPRLADISADSPDNPAVIFFFFFRLPTLAICIFLDLHSRFGPGVQLTE